MSEIARQVAQSAAIARQAVDEAKRTNTTMEGLAAAAGKIGDVVKLHPQGFNVEMRRQTVHSFHRGRQVGKAQAWQSPHRSEGINHAPRCLAFEGQSTCLNFEFVAVARMGLYGDGYHHGYGWSD